MGFMKTEQEQRRAIRQILFDANDICQATPCENEYCIYHGDYRCYDNVIVDKLIRAGYGDVSEYKAEIERLKADLDHQINATNDAENIADHLKYVFDKARKQAQTDVLNKLKTNLSKSDDFVDICSWHIDKLIKEVENDK